jgi:hypothetical protein
VQTRETDDRLDRTALADDRPGEYDVVVTTRAMLARAPGRPSAFGFRVCIAADGRTTCRDPIFMPNMAP